MVRPRRTLVCVLICFLAAPAAQGSEQSERLYSRGLRDFHAGRYEEALEYFDRAVQADPRDAYALYYRGVTKGRLNRFDAAVSDLQAAVAADPAIAQANLEIGVALVKVGRFAEAVPWLERAGQIPATSGDASLYSGIAQLRLGRLDAARESFRRAAEQPELRTSATYYLGVVEHDLGNLSQAEKHFTSVVERTPDSAIGEEAAAFLAGIQGAERPRTVVYGEVGLQYDSNVTLAPSDDDVSSDLGITDEDDGRAVITAGGYYVPWRNESAELILGYEFYQSLYFEHSEFDLQDHRPSVQIAAKNGPVRFGLATRYDYNLLDNRSFLQEVHALPWFTLEEPGFGRTELFYRFRWHGFYPEPFESLRDAYNHSVGVRQIFFLPAPEQYIFLGYRFDREEAVNSEGRQFEYDGHEPSTGIGWILPYGLGAEFSYAYRYQDYETSREDNEHGLVFAAQKRLTENLSVVLAYYGVFNDSNESEFEYDRNIGSLTLRARF